MLPVEQPRVLRAPQQRPGGPQNAGSARNAALAGARAMATPGSGNYHHITTRGVAMLNSGTGSLNSTLSHGSGPNNNLPTGGGGQPPGPPGAPAAPQPLLHQAAIHPAPPYLSSNQLNKSSSIKFTFDPETPATTSATTKRMSIVGGSLAPPASIINATPSTDTAKVTSCGESML